LRVKPPRAYRPESRHGGPIARTVTDAAILLGILQSPFEDVAARSLPIDLPNSWRMPAARLGLLRTQQLSCPPCEEDWKSDE